MLYAGGVVEILDRGPGAVGERRRIFDEPQQRMGIEQERHLPIVGEVVQRRVEVGRNIGERPLGEPGLARAAGRRDGPELRDPFAAARQALQNLIQQS